jgi:serine/threonine protein kinase
MTGGIWDVLSSEAKDLIKKMLTYKYKDRIHAREALLHPWFKNASSTAVDINLM